MVVRETLKQSQKRMKRDYDVKVRVKELKLGDLVYQLDTATVKGKTRKLDLNAPANCGKYLSQLR
jgi:hypothetical protein